MCLVQMGLEVHLVLWMEAGDTLVGIHTGRKAQKGKLNEVFGVEICVVPACCCLFSTPFDFCGFVPISWTCF